MAISLLNAHKQRFMFMRIWQVSSLVFLSTLSSCLLLGSLSTESYTFITSTKVTIVLVPQWIFIIIFRFHICSVYNQPFLKPTWYSQIKCPIYCFSQCESFRGKREKRALRERILQAIDKRDWSMQLFGSALLSFLYKR